MQQDVPLPQSAALNLTFIAVAKRVENRNFKWPDMNTHCAHDLLKQMLTADRVNLWSVSCESIWELQLLPVSEGCRTCLLCYTGLDVRYFWWKINNEITSDGFQGFTSPGSLFIFANISYELSVIIVHQGRQHYRSHVNPRAMRRHGQ